MSLDKFTKIRWHNAKSKTWTTDYTSVDNDQYCFVTIEEKNPRIAYCLSKNLGKNIDEILESACQKILVKNVQIKCLSMINGNNSITGTFEIAEITEEDGYANWSTEGNTSE